MSINPVNESLRQFIRLQHYRLHCAEEWPDSPIRKQCSQRSFRIGPPRSHGD